MKREIIEAYVEALKFVNSTLENELKRLRDSGIKLNIRLTDEIMGELNEPKK